MPPGYNAKVGNLQTFTLPADVTDTPGHRAMGRAMIQTWRQEGILQISTDSEGQQLQQQAMEASRRFFRRPSHEKAACVDSQSYAGYIASGEEITDGIADYSEIFTVLKDLPPSDPRVQAQWPCHGPCPWPPPFPDRETTTTMKAPIEAYMTWLGRQGERLLRLIEYGLGVSEGSLTRYTRDGWHHQRVLRFPARNATNGRGKTGRGIGSHTDYGLLVIASQDDVGGLFIRPPRQDEEFANWEKSAAGLREEDDGWVYVPPVPDVHTVFLGDMMQYLTKNHLTATPHKVGLNTRERFVFAYFHEPNFAAVLKPLDGSEGALHYGTHFTNMFMRNYPDRITTQRLVRENRYDKLAERELRCYS
ncbi:hypothetical protein ASPZODRAFT_16065 [Penicilliopsis zonata CBS 506.65]|uniref:Fe2OG dioxygenase domain-containing protein n=1 Tax=Penicilliopsis zonata CBS 506.65 TaxID=1073090 RepID=A0A1L9SJZ6_9EURO|nr:hypothetical protein ASPZODRAFT_16065 [Penicilliopsis zonata CBS 506.65]OJJ47384.1 hypothetical protein ASPZODRAFT_16065 [Penicilliopsis zonata CBS 506.65]